MPGKKDYMSTGWNMHKQKQSVLCNLSELCSAFRDIYPNIKIRFSNFCTLRPKWFVLAGSSGTHSVCVCSTHQNAVLLVDAIDCKCTYKDLMKKVVCDPGNKQDVYDASLWVMSGRCCFEKVSGRWAQSSGYGLWIPLLSVANNRSCCTGHTYNNIQRIQGNPYRQHQQPNSTLVPGKSPSKTCEIEEGISWCKRGYRAWGLCRELLVSDPGQGTKLPLEQKVLHIAFPSHLLQRCW